ncbi:hypothetical protein EFN44_04350 [Propionibacterium freudenreichii]|nr:hypothetical protein [Propionibacterium freudenreichii]
MWVHHTHLEVVAAYSLGPVLADQQRYPFLLLPPECRFTVGGDGLDGLGGVDHARIGLGALGGNVGSPFGETVGAARCGAPFGADLSAQRLSVVGRGAVLGAGFASAEPADRGEPGACGGFTLDSAEIGSTVVCGLGSEWPGDLGAHSRSLVFGLVERGSALVVLGSVCGALGIESGGSMLPPLRRLLGTLYLLVKPCEFFGDQRDQAVADEAAHGF